jgi:hypothetical protein
MQLELETTALSTSLRGLAVVTSGECRKCRSTLATLGSTSGPHQAAIICAGCGRYRGWLPAIASDFLNGILDEFGRPTDPIRLRWGR